MKNQKYIPPNPEWWYDEIFGAWPPLQDPTQPELYPSQFPWPPTLEDIDSLNGGMIHGEYGQQVR